MICQKGPADKKIVRKDQGLVAAGDTCVMPPGPGGGIHLPPGLAAACGLPSVAVGHRHAWWAMPPGLRPQADVAVDDGPTVTRQRTHLTARISRH
jgi:hypothetical protein